MKIYFDRKHYYTRDKLIRMVRSEAVYVVDPQATFAKDEKGKDYERVVVDGVSYVVFKPERLNDEELVRLVTQLYGGYIVKCPIGGLAISGSFIEIDVEE